MTCRHACNTWVLHRMYVWTTYAYTRPDPQTILIAGFWFLIHRGQPSKTVILYTHMYTHIITHMLLYIYTCNMWTYLPKLRDLYTYAYIYVYIYIYTQMCVYLHIYIHTYNIHIYNIYIYIDSVEAWSSPEGNPSSLFSTLKHVIFHCVLQCFVFFS